MKPNIKSINCKMSIEQKCVTFIKKAIIELSCSTDLAHRQEYTSDVSRLKEEMAKNNYQNIDLVITNIVKEFLEEENTIEMIEFLQKESSVKDESESESEDEEETQKPYLFFREFIQFVGLNELLALHSDEHLLFFLDDFVEIFTN